MHITDSAQARVLRRAAVGPHALMQRRSVLPFVPDRGTSFSQPNRLRSLGYLGDTSNLVKTAGTVYTGAGVGAAVAGTTVAASVAAAAAAGSFVPVIGTAIGAIVGLVASGVFNHRKDPEVANFDAAVAMYKQNPQSVLNIADKYLVLAGLFDLLPGQIKGNIPIYKKYGRMGEEHFTHDMVMQVYNAAQSGQITAGDTVQSVYNRIVQPWIDSFNFGPMQDANGDMINLIILGLVAEYITGLWKTRWYARSGDFPASFRSLPDFSLPQTLQPAQPQVTASPTPSPVSGAATPELQGYLNGAVPTTGSSIGYLRGPTGNSPAFAAIPSGGKFYGIDPVTRGWIVQYASGLFELSGSQLTPYQATVTAPTTTAAVVSPTTAPYVAITPPSTAVQTLPSYLPSSGGSLPMTLPTATVPMTATNTGFSTEELVLAGGVGLILMVLLLKGKKS